MYMYTKLKEALMGKGKSVSGKDWSPNSVKAIVITREFIVIAYHVKQAKLVQLDINESMQDISRNGSQGSLHNLLSQKQLSCLEEIYVDSIFQNYKGTMDLERYVNGLVNSASRLRFYGYIEPGNVYDIVNNYGKAQLNGLVDYTYAMDMERVLSVQYQSTNNDSWYTKYNLRPDKYSLDSNRGVLHTWFKKVETEVEKRKKEELSRSESEGIGSAIQALFKQDVEYAEDIVCILKLRKELAKKPFDAVIKSVQEQMNTMFKGVIKVSPKLLQENVSINGKREDLILYAYKNFGVFCEEGTSLKLEELVYSVKSFSGFLCLPDVLRQILLKVVKNRENRLSDAQMITYIVLSSMGEVIDIAALEDVIIEKRDSLGCVRWYTDLLLGICGYNRESISNI